MGSSPTSKTPSLSLCTDLFDDRINKDYIIKSWSLSGNSNTWHCSVEMIAQKHFRLSRMFPALDRSRCFGRPCRLLWMRLCSFLGSVLFLSAVNTLLERTWPSPLLPLRCHRPAPSYITAHRSWVSWPVRGSDDCASDRSRKESRAILRATRHGDAESSEKLI